MGSPEFAVPSLQYLFLNGYEVLAVYTKQDRPAGRGRSLTQSPVKKAALDLGLPVKQPRSLKAEQEVAELAELQPDLIVLAAYGLILPQPVLDIPRYGCINIHPSLLPRFRGAAPVAATILSGDEFAGVSIMRMDAGLDTGPVLTRAQISIAPFDTTGSLTGKLAITGARLLGNTLVYWLRGELNAQSQDESRATYHGPLRKEEAEIDWQKPAREIWQRVRAFQPWPGAYTRWQGKRLEIIEAMPLSIKDNFKPGEVVTPGTTSPALNAGFGIGTGEGVLGIIRVQLEGKKPVPAAEFLRGQRQIVGTVLPQG